METKHRLLQEETIEDKIERIGGAIQHSILEMDLSSQQIRNSSRITYLNSYTNSYCNFDWIDAEASSMIDSKLEPQLESNIETLLLSLNRSQMQVEDFWSDCHRNSNKPPPERPIKSTPVKTRLRPLKENKSPDHSKLFSSIEYRKSQLEQERRNFELKLVELDQLTNTYKIKHRFLAELEENLTIKENFLVQREKDLIEKKVQLDKSKALWDNIVINDKFKLNLIKFKPDSKAGAQEAPNTDSTPTRASQICSLQQSLKINEMKLSESQNEEEKSRLMTIVDMIKNKIGNLRGEQVMVECSKSSKIMKDMRRTMEKEVNYEENLRKINLEKFSVRGSNRNTPKSSMTPNCGVTSKRFLFQDNQ